MDDIPYQFEEHRHGDTLLAGVKQLRENRLLFDIELVVDDVHFPAHKVVLASCSEYFRAMFTDGLDESRQNEIILKGVSSAGLKNILDFAYSSKLLLDFDNIEDIVSSANYFQIFPVLKACSNFLKSHLSLENCTSIVEIADLYSLTDLKLHVFRFICSNFKQFCTTTEFLNSTSSILSDLLKSNFPMNCSEDYVLDSALKWLSHDLQDREQNQSSILSHVQYSNIPLSQFDSVTSECTVLQDQDEIQRMLTKYRQICQRFDPVSSYGASHRLLNTRGYRQCIILCGGFRERVGMTNNILSVDVDSMKCTSLTQIPHVVQCDYQVAVLENQLYVLGGSYNDNYEMTYDVVHNYGFKYDPLFCSWKSILPMLRERSGFYVGAVNGYLFAIGGENLSLDMVGVQSDCERYCPRTNTWTAIKSLPFNRKCHAGATLGKYVYISGGKDEMNGEIFSFFHRYDTEVDEWEPKCPMNSARVDHSMFTFNGQVFVIGGWNDVDERTLLGCIDVYDPASDCWESYASVPQPRLYATYTTLEEKLYVVGGWVAGDLNQKASSVLVFDLCTKEWSELESLSMEIWEQNSCSLHIPL